jgi:GNAT superfamily N-acetyltransferase
MMAAPPLPQALAQSWPSARSFALGPFTIRSGMGGGKRVSAGSLTCAQWQPDDLIVAEGAMRDLGQTPLFVIWPDRPAQGAFDQALAQRGYDKVDPCMGYIACIADILIQNVDISNTYSVWPPLAICDDLWQSAGITAARRAVMARAQGAKTAILARYGDDPAGVCFAAIVGKTAMVHAIEVMPQHRRQGSAQKLIHRAAIWAQQQGAVNLGLVVTVSNTPACALYAKIGMQVWGTYHYRQLRQE